MMVLYAISSLMVCYTIMKAQPVIVRRRIEFEGEDAFVELVVWRVPQPVPPCLHHYRYSLTYVQNGQRVVSYDNERGKGDHRHLHEVESAVNFVSIDDLIQEFAAIVKAVRGGKL